MTLAAEPAGGSIEHHLTWSSPAREKRRLSGSRKKNRARKCNAGLAKDECQDLTGYASHWLQSRLEGQSSPGAAAAGTSGVGLEEDWASGNCTVPLVTGAPA